MTSAGRRIVQRGSRSRRQQVADILTDINAQVAGIPRPVLRELAPAIKQAEKEISRKLALALQGARDETFTTQAYRNAVVQLRAALEAVQRLEPEIVRVLRRGGRHAGEMATAHVRSQLVTFGEIFEGTIRHLPIEPAAVMAQTDKLLLGRYRTSAARYVHNVSMDFAAMKREMVSGFVQGENFGQIATRLQRFGGPRGKVAVRGVAGEPGAVMEDVGKGLFIKHRYWAERIVRTEVINAYNANAALGIETLQVRDADIVQRWDAALDMRTCAECEQLDGKIIEAGEDFLPGVAHPPLHPHCRCAVVAWRKSWDDRVSKQADVIPDDAPAGRAEAPL